MLNLVREKLQHYSPQAMQSHAPLHQPQNPKTVREAAVLVALTHGDSPAMVFIKRAEHVSSHQGQVAFPGGMWEVSDSSLLETALRESEEEIDLPRKHVEMVAALTPRTTRFDVRVSPFVGFIPEGLKFTPEEAELDAVFHVPMSYLLDASNYTRDVFDTPVGQYETACIIYEQYRIWGFTFTVLLEILAEVFDFVPPVSQEIILNRSEAND